MQLGGLGSLVPRKNTQWPQDVLPGADGWVLRVELLPWLGQHR